MVAAEVTVAEVAVVTEVMGTGVAEGKVTGAAEKGEAEVEVKAVEKEKAEAED
jgi:hypothetical protein